MAKLTNPLNGSVVNPKVLKRCKLALAPLMIKSDKFSDQRRYVVSLPLVDDKKSRLYSDVIENDIICP